MSSTRQANHHRVKSAGNSAGQRHNRVFERHRLPGRELGAGCRGREVGGRGLGGVADDRAVDVDPHRAVGLGLAGGRVDPVSRSGWVAARLNTSTSSICRLLSPSVTALGVHSPSCASHSGGQFLGSCAYGCSPELCHRTFSRLTASQLTADHGWTVSGERSTTLRSERDLFGRTDGGLPAVRSAECGPAAMRRYRV